MGLQVCIYVNSGRLTRNYLIQDQIVIIICCFNA